jgi:hypothetical protein
MTSRVTLRIHRARTFYSADSRNLTTHAAVWSRFGASPVPSRKRNAAPLTQKQFANDITGR